MWPKNSAAGLSASAATLAFVLPTVAALCFWNKAVHQDDWAYLRVADLLVSHGGDVLSQSTTYQGLPITVETGVMHGPVWLWILALAKALGGEAHQLGLAHAVSALCLGLLGLSTASLSARIGARPLPTALALCLAPLPLVLAGGLMTDLPMVALFTASMALAVRAMERGRRWELCAAGLLGLGAGLTRYHGLACLPLLAALPLLWPGLSPALRRRGLWAAGTVLAGLIAFLTVAFWATGGLELDRARAGITSVKIDHNACLLAAVAALGAVGLGLALGAAFAPSRALALIRSHPLGSAALLLGLPLGVAFGIWGWSEAAVRPPQLWNQGLHHVAFVLGGLFLAAALAPFSPAAWRGSLSAWRDRHGAAAWLSLWLLGFVVAAWWTLPFGATRYALPALPALFLGGGALLGRLPLRAALAATAISAALGFSAALADHRAAAIYPRLASEVRERTLAGGPWHGSKTWIWGELGFRWYLETLAGLEVLPTASTAPRAGDRILKSMVLSTASPDDGRTGRYRLHPDVVRRMESELVVEFHDPFPVRIHNSHAGAGFYGSDGGFLPYVFARPAHDRLQVWAVRDSDPFVDGLAGARRTAAPGGFVRAQRVMVSPAEEQLMAVEILFPGSVTYPDVAIPAQGAELHLLVGEHDRLSYVPERPITVARVLVDGEVVAEARFTARGDQPRRWMPLSADLDRFAGRPVEVTLEVSADPPDAAGPDGKPPLVNAGFARVRIEPR